MAEIKLNKDLQNYVDRLDKENLNKIRSAFDELVEFFIDNRFDFVSAISIFDKLLLLIGPAMGGAQIKTDANLLLL